MSLISNIDVTISANINIDQGGLSDGRAHSPNRFIANIGSFMLRFIPWFILAAFGISSSSNASNSQGGNTWRPK